MFHMNPNPSENLKGKHEPTDEEAVFPLADTDSEDEDRFVLTKKKIY